MPHVRSMFKQTIATSLCLAAMATLPMAASAQRSVDGSGGLTGTSAGRFLDQEQNVRITEEGNGWQRWIVSDPTTTEAALRRDDVELIAVWKRGLRDAPLSDAQKAELMEDFGAFNNDFKVSSTEVILIDKALADAMESGESLDPWRPYADNETTNKFGCSGWKTKTETENWDFDEGHYSEDFELGENINGNFNIHFPIQGQSTLEVTYSYKRNFLCIPYKLRFDQARIHGNVDILGSSLFDASVAVQGSWSKTRRIMNPRVGRATFYIGPIPFVINFHLPVDVGFQVDAQAEATLTVGSDLRSSGTFDYTCNRDTCWGSSNFPDKLDENGITGSIEVGAQAKVFAQVMLRADLYDDDFLYVEAGLKGYLEGDFWGFYGNNCGDGDGDGINETVRGLTVGVDGGYDWVYGIGGIVNDRQWTAPGDEFYLGWWDLLGEGGSTALSPMIEGPSEVTVGVPAAYNIRMRPCYPFTEPVTFAMAPNVWTGDMTLEDPQSSVETTTKIFGSQQAYDIRAMAVRDSKGRILRVPQWRRIHARNPVPPPALELSYIPQGGGARKTYRSIDEGQQPTQLFQYNEAAGNFEERRGGICEDGSNNSTYVKIKYDGPAMTSCTFATQTTNGHLTCSAALIEAFNNGHELVINTDTLVTDPNTCELKQPHEEVCGPGTYCWVAVHMQIDGETVKRSVAFRR